FDQIAAPARRGDVEPGGSAFLQEIAEHRERFLDAMDDDFNTGGAIGELFETAHVLNRFASQPSPGFASLKSNELDEYRKGTVVLKELSQILGLFRRPSAGPERLTGTLSEPLLGLLIELRSRLREEKSFGLADLVRKRLSELGVMLEDKPDGTRWRIERGH